MLFFFKNLADLKPNFNWERKPDVFGKICDPVLLHPPEIPDVLPLYRSRVPAVESLSYAHCYALPNHLNIYTCYIFLITCLNISTETLKNSGIRLRCILHVPWFESPLFIRISNLSSIAKQHVVCSTCACAPHTPYVACTGVLKCCLTTLSTTTSIQLRCGKR